MIKWPKLMAMTSDFIIIGIIILLHLCHDKMFCVFP